MYELKNNGKLFTSKFVRTGPSSYKKRIYRAAVSQRLRNTVLDFFSDRHISDITVAVGSVRSSNDVNQRRLVYLPNYCA